MELVSDVPESLLVSDVPESLLVSDAHAVVSRDLASRRRIAKDERKLLPPTARKDARARKRRFRYRRSKG